jgi:hypothetical protein
MQRLFWAPHVSDVLAVQSLQPAGGCTSYCALLKMYWYAWVSCDRSTLAHWQDTHAAEVLEAMGKLCACPPSVHTFTFVPSPQVRPKDLPVRTLQKLHHPAAKDRPACHCDNNTSTSSCQQRSLACPCVCVHWSLSAGHGLAGPAVHTVQAGGRGVRATHSHVVLLHIHSDCGHLQTHADRQKLTVSRQASRQAIIRLW